jgi:hypothetical protein
LIFIFSGEDRKAGRDEIPEYELKKMDRMWDKVVK